MLRYLEVVAANLVLASVLFSTMPAASADLNELEEVVVTGRLPGPPLWKISSGEHALWILPLIDAYPRKMEWDSARVEALIAGSEEYIERPHASVGVSPGKGVNTFSVLRAIATASPPRSPKGQKLADVLSPELYRRFSLLKARYLPRDKEIEAQRVSVAGARLQREILDRENLETLTYSYSGSPKLITEKLDKWLNRNRKIRRTSPSRETVVEITSRDLKLMKEAAADPGNLSAFASWEVACMEKTVTWFEKDFEAVKKRANAWAQGHADDLVDHTPLPGQGYGYACIKLAPIPDESPAMARLRREAPAIAALLLDEQIELELRSSKQLWLAAAEKALARNMNTFSVLHIDDILDQGGLVSQLQAKGYKVEISSR